MFPEIGSVGRNEKKKKKTKKKHHKIGRGGLAPQHHCCGAWKQQDIFRLTTRMTFKVNIYISGLKKCMTYCKKGSCSAKDFGWSNNAKQSKKRGWP